MPGDFERYLHPATLSRNTHALPGNQWYQPLLAGAETLRHFLFEVKAYEGVLHVLKSLGQDEYSKFVISLYQQGLADYGANWRYADICTVLYALSAAIQAESYLEIGVRRGRSMAMVAARRPQARIVGFDMWLDNYAGMENPGPRFVVDELKKVGFQGSLELVSGDSHKTVPEYFEQHPEAWFDLITVDGDHTELGARADLLQVIQRLKVGGVLVFDDISHPSHKYLAQVWRKTIKSRDNFLTFEFTDLGYGVAFAVRRY